MFPNSVDTTSQFVGLVAHSRPSVAGNSSLTQTCTSTDATVLPPPLPTLVAPPPLMSREYSEAPSHASHSRLSSMVSGIFAHDTHEPFEKEEQFDPTPLLLQQMDAILSSAYEASKQARINVHQCALVSRRLRLIAVTLRQMRTPAPSQRLLTAMRSLALLLRQCAQDGVGDANPTPSTDGVSVLYGADGDPLGPAQSWPMLLRLYFTCRPLFQAGYRRLWSAWSLYSRAELEREDGIAESRDRANDAEIMTELGCGDVAADDDAVVHSPCQQQQQKLDIMTYYQRREMSPWKILFQDLVPTAKPVSGGAPTGEATTAMRPTVQTPMERMRKGEEGARFRVLPHLYRYNSISTVVKALCGADGGSDGETVQAAALEWAAEFQLDVSCRVLWRHPHLVTVLGGFTEKFVEGAATERPSGAAAEGGGGTANHDSRAKGSEVSPTTETFGTPPWQRDLSTLSGKPVMALGYVQEWQYCASSFSFPGCSCGVAPSCMTLRDLLFGVALPPTAARNASTKPHAVVSRHHFTIYEALDICAQLADALQYILDDRQEVSEAVQMSWLTVDPSNLFVVRVAGLGGEAAQPQPEKGGVGPSLEHPVVHSEGGADSVFAGSASPVEHAVELPNVKQGTGQRLHQAPAGKTEGEVPCIVPNKEVEREMSPCAGGDDGSASGRHSNHFVIRYSPPCCWAKSGGPRSRWGPHPGAVTPASYVVAQLFLALVTGQAPPVSGEADVDGPNSSFKHAPSTPHDASLSSESGYATRATAYGKANHRMDSGSSSRIQTYLLPASLPHAAVGWCSQALSLDHRRRGMELEALRDSLAIALLSLPDTVLHTSWHVGLGKEVQDSEKGNNSQPVRHTM